MSIYYTSLRGSGLVELQLAVVQRGSALKYLEGFSSMGELDGDVFIEVRLAGSPRCNDHTCWPCRRGACSNCLFSFYWIKAPLCKLSNASSGAPAAFLVGFNALLATYMEGLMAHRGARARQTGPANVALAASA